MSAKTRNAIASALALFVVWTAATWFLEGRIQTLLRPEAVISRLIYVVVANFLIGIVGTSLVLRLAFASAGTNQSNTGFGARAPSVIWIPVGIALGLALYLVQGAPSYDPIVIFNVYAQVFAVSVAEVLVCWAAVGGVLWGAFSESQWLKDAAGQYSRWIATLLAAVIASTLFGLYHFGHSPPFNTIGMVTLLTLIGLWTSAFLFISRDVYATIAFHNFLGVFGVVQALANADQIGTFSTLQLPLLGTAIVALLALIAADVFVIRRAPA
jgi:hypothetical protein